VSVLPVLTNFGSFGQVSSYCDQVAKCKSGQKWSIMILYVLLERAMSINIWPHLIQPILINFVIVLLKWLHISYDAKEWQIFHRGMLRCKLHKLKYDKFEKSV